MSNDPNAGEVSADESTEPTEAEEIITATAAARGWSKDDCIRLLCEFIEEDDEVNGAQRLLQFLYAVNKDARRL